MRSLAVALIVVNHTGGRSMTADGIPVFPDTDIPLLSLVEHLRRGGDLESFLTQHPGLPRPILLDVLAGALDRVAKPSVTARQGSLLPQIDGSGTIVNPEELTANQVIGRRSSCPACHGIVFRTWPEGWDSHAAYRCSGLASTAVEARKREFKQRFAHLFR